MVSALDLRGNRFYALVDELWDGRTGTAATIEGERTYLRRFLVIVRRKELGPFDVCNAPGIPGIAVPYVLPNGVEYDLLALSRRKTARQMDSDDWSRWVVEVEYSTKMPPGGPTNNPDHPELEPPDIRWTHETYQEAPLYDRDGTPFLNSAGMPYSPPPTFDKAYPVLSISRNELTFDLIKADYFSYALNHARFLGWPRGTAQSLPPETEQRYRGKLVYWRTHYKIRFRLRLLDLPGDGGFRIPTLYVQGGNAGGPAPGIIIPGEELDSWQPRLLDQGLMKRVVNDGPDKATRPTVLLACRGDDNKPVSHPVLLNGKGDQQTVKDGKGNLIAIYRTYNVYRYADLTALIVRGLGL